MRNIIIGIGIVLFLLGATWFFQGIGVLPGSVMTGQSFWAVMGLIIIVVGVAVGVWGYRCKPSDPEV